MHVPRQGGKSRERFVDLPRWAIVGTPALAMRLSELLTSELVAACLGTADNADAMLPAVLATEALSAKWKPA